MNLPDTIYAHARALPIDLQREALDFIAWLGRRYRNRPPAGGELGTDAFIQRFAGSLGDDFPDDIGELDAAADTPRETLE
jgi:hypothetical protein